MGVFVPFPPLTGCETMSLPEPRSLHLPRGWWGPTPGVLPHLAKDLGGWQSSSTANAWHFLCEQPASGSEERGEKWNDAAAFPGHSHLLCPGPAPGLRELSNSRSALPIQGSAAPRTLLSCVGDQRLNGTLSPGGSSVPQVLSAYFSLCP